MFRESAPSSDRAPLPDEQVIIARQTYGGDVGEELQGLLQLHQRQVVLVGEEVVIRVDFLPLDGALHVGMRLLHGGEVVLAHANADLLDEQAGEEWLMYDILEFEEDQMKKKY